jgi:hypothetical protein
LKVGEGSFTVSGFQFLVSPAVRVFLNTFVPRYARPSHCPREAIQLRSSHRN